MGRTFIFYVENKTYVSIFSFVRRDFAEIIIAIGQAFIAW